MPLLPSGRRVEFSLDRFHAYLRQMPADRARLLAEEFDDPDDLLYVLDAVHFGLSDGAPYFADYVAADWRSYAAEWPAADRAALQAWFDSPAARGYRAEAIGYIKDLLLERAGRALVYPYLTVGEANPANGVEISRLRQ